MKGGVGKTTTVVSLSETLAAEPQNSVLVVDVDTQASASYCLAGDTILTELIHDDRTVDEFFQKRLVDNVPCPINNFIRQQVSHLTHLDRQINVSLLASSPFLRLTEREIIHALTLRKYSMGAIEGRTSQVLDPVIRKLRKEYNFILFDCAPGISAFTTAAISLSDLIIIPTIPDFLSHLGLAAFVESVLNNMKKDGPTCKPHVLITRKNNTNQHKKYHALITDMAKQAGAKFAVFKTVIPENAQFPKALEMIEGGYPTYRQKYESPLDGILSGLAGEVKETLHEHNH
jgi:cellulose biosynthesis protein BcsQ